MAHIYCPNCKGIMEMKTAGASTQPKAIKSLYFRRTRKCKSCDKTFNTVEVEEGILKEFEQLKELVVNIYGDIESAAQKMRY